MKQFAFMAATLFLGTAGAVVLSPVYGVAVYYAYAVLRPQSIWDWVEVAGVRLADVNWSFAVAVVTLGATAAWRLRVWTPPAAAADPWYGGPAVTRTHLLFLAFTGWIGLTYVTARHPDVAWPYFLEYVKIFVMFGCAALVLRTVRDLWVIYYVVIGCAAYIAYEVNVYYLTTGWLMLSARGFGGLDNNGAALIFAMAVPLCFFAWEAARGWWRWGLLLVVPVLLHAVLLSFSRGAMLSLCVAAVPMYLRARNKRFVTAVYAAGLCLVAAMAGPQVQERFFSIGNHGLDESANARKVTWGIAVRMANENPVFGMGVRNSNLYTLEYGADIPGRSIHSQYLQTAADSGWVALALYLALLASAFAGLWETRRVLRPFTDPGSERVKSMVAGIECALVLFCFGALFLSLEHFELPYVCILLAVQVHAITRAVQARLRPARSGLPPLTLPYPYPAASRPAAVSS